jgi:hypothetical protein
MMRRRFRGGIHQKRCRFTFRDKRFPIFGRRKRRKQKEK